MSRARYSDDSGRRPDLRCYRDPVSLTAASLAATAIGGGIKAAGSLASGTAAKQAADYKAAQLQANATQAVASGQRQMFDTQQRTRLAMSTATARAGASGFASDTGSPVTNAGELAQRGSYQAAMSLFNGESTATGLENEAQGVIYTGEAQQQASYLAAGGDVAGAVGSVLATYGRYAYPTTRGSPGGDA